MISNAVKYTDVNGVINIGIVNDWLYIENTYGNNKISNMDKIFDVKFDLNKENSNGLGLYIVSNILNNYNMEYKALQDEEILSLKLKYFLKQHIILQYLLKNRDLKDCLESKI